MGSMNRILLDTNIFGLIAIDIDRSHIIDLILKCNIAVYSTRLNRKELRAVPKATIVSGKKLRIDLLNLFDALTGEHIYEITGEMVGIADNYYNAYRKFGGSKSKKEILDDFIIVACATSHEMDIVVSSDEKSMTTENAIKAYELVNSIVKKRTPEFLNYLRFKNTIKKRST